MSETISSFRQKKPSQVSTNRDAGYQVHQLIRGGGGEGGAEKKEGEVVEVEKEE